MKIFTDSSFDENKNVCGIGMYIENNGVNTTISNFIYTNDNNYGEMYAIYLAALLGHGKNCTIYTDSLTAVDYIEDHIKEKPRTNEAFERHQRLKLMAYKIRQLKPDIRWVKGHKKCYQQICIGNQLADILAKQGRAKLYER